jgi:hypothetical protein
MSFLIVAGCARAQTLPAPALPTSSVPALASVPTPEGTETYWAFLAKDQQTWCAYSKRSNFEARAESEKPTESARLAFTANKLSELTYQIEAESGDWVLVDHYTLNDRGAVLRRASLLVQANLQVIQESTIRGKSVEPFRVITVTTLRGETAELSPNVDLPEVPVSVDFVAMAPVKVVEQMRRRAIDELCMETD